LPGITDEFSIGIDYNTLDKMLMMFEEGKLPSELKEFDEKLLNLVYEHYKWVKKEKNKPLSLERIKE